MVRLMLATVISFLTVSTFLQTWLGALYVNASAIRVKCGSGQQHVVLFAVHNNKVFHERTMEIFQERLIQSLMVVF